MFLNVFYIDDEEDLCENFSDSFTSENVKITTFTDPGKATEAIIANVPHIIFIDYRLPGTTGDKIALKMNLNIPIFLVTGELSVVTEYKFVRVFKKPYKFGEIQAILDENFLRLS